MWIHLKCSKFENFKEAREYKDTYVCAKCIKGNDTPQKEDIINHPKSFESEGVKIMRAIQKLLRDGKWLTDSILSYAFNEMDERYGNKHRNMVFVKPEISQLIKASTDQDEVEKTIRNIGLRSWKHKREHHAILQEQKLKSSEPFWKKIHRHQHRAYLEQKAAQAQIFP